MSSESRSGEQLLMTVLKREMTRSMILVSTRVGSVEVEGCSLLCGQYIEQQNDGRIIMRYGRGRSHSSQNDLQTFGVGSAFE
jgi:hypothetical protein